MSANATRPATATVRYDVERSTPWNRLYWVKSLSRPHMDREVRYSETKRAWACSCPARVECRHIKLARDWANAHWWRQQFATMHDEALKLCNRGYAALYERGELTDEDRVAWTVLQRLMAERRQTAA